MENATLRAIFIDSINFVMAQIRDVVVLNTKTYQDLMC